MIKFIFLFMLWIQLANAAAPTPPNPANVPNKTSGDAPLCVHFDATSTTGGTKPFHNLLYHWSFGEANAGTWTTGTGVNIDRNGATSPIAAHCYYKPATYTWHLSIVNSAGEQANISGSITVSNPDTTYSGANTICVANVTPVAGQDNCPSGATVKTGTSDWATVIGYIAQNKRVLLRCGDTFNFNTTTDIGVAGPWVLGAYGSNGATAYGSGVAPCAGGNGPILNNTAVVGGGSSIYAVHLIAPSSPNIQILDIWMNGNNFISAPDPAYGAIGVATAGTSVGLTLTRLYIYGGLGGVQGENFNGAWDLTGFALVDSHTNNVYTNGMYLLADKGIVMGNLFENATISHNVRLQYFSKGVFDHNTSRLSYGDTLKVHSASITRNITGTLTALTKCIDTITGTTTNVKVGTYVSDAGNTHIPANTQVTAVNVCGTPPSFTIGAATSDFTGSINFTGVLRAATQYVEISDNLFQGGGAGGYNVWMHSENIQTDELVEDVIFERNRLTVGPTANAATSNFIVNGANITIRNNVIDMSNIINYSIPANINAYAITVGATGVEAPATGVDIYNNTCYTGTATNFTCIFLQNVSGMTSLAAQNNLGYAPNAPKDASTSLTYPVMVQDASGSTPTLGNNTLSTDGTAQMKAVNPFNVTPSTLIDFRNVITGTYSGGPPSSVINGGTALYPATSDDFLHCANNASHVRMGAFEPKAEAICSGVAGP